MLDWQITLTYLPNLLYAAMRTIQLTVLTVLLGAIIAVPLAIIRQSSNKVLVSIVAAYSWLMRTCPVLLILYFCYYGLPRLGLRLPAFEVAVIGGGLSSGAYYMEILRGGLLAVPKGQYDAAQALGLTPLRVWQRIILPQAIPVALPPFISNTQLILKGSSLASIITVNELTGIGNGIISITYRVLEILFPVAAIYLALNSMLTLAQHWGERRWTIKK